MNDGTLAVAFGMGLNTGGLATHLVTITFDDGREYQFKATCMRDEEADEDEPLTIYKVEHGKKDYDTYIEWTDDETVTICVEDEYIIADLLDNNLDEESASFEFDCDDDGVGIHIQCDFILGQDDQDLADIVRTAAYDSDGNEIDFDRDEEWNGDYDDIDDDEDINFEDDDYLDSDDEDNVDRRDVPCQIKGIETNCSPQKFIKEIKKKGFVFDFKYEQSNSAYENQVFHGVFAKRNCELTIRPLNYDTISSIDIDFPKTGSIHQAISDYHDIVNTFSQKYGWYSRKEDEKLDDIKSTLKNASYFETLAQTTFDFIDEDDNLINSIDIILLSDFDDQTGGRQSWITITFFNYDDEDTTSLDYLDI